MFMVKNGENEEKCYKNRFAIYRYTNRIYLFETENHWPYDSINNKFYYTMRVSYQELVDLK